MKFLITLLVTCSCIGAFAQPPNLHWKYQDDEKSYAEDRGFCTKFDPSGNLVTAGYVESGCTGIDICIIKYAANGDTLWMTTYDGSGVNQDEDFPQEMTIDASGNIYITGKSEDNNYYYAVTLKYDSAGNLLWAKRYLTAESTGNDIAVDFSGNVYICGYREISNNKDFLLIKYNSSGVLQWMQNYSNGNHDEAIALELDSTGNVYVTGRQSGVNYIFDWATLKYNSAGTQQWVDVYANSTSTFSEEPSEMVIDNAGAIYVTGSSPLLSTSNRDIFTIKYDQSGNRIWENFYQYSLNNNDEYPLDMSVDGDGNVFIVGNIIGNGTGQDIGIFKINSTGQVAWEVTIDSIQQPDYARSIGIDPSGDYIYITGDLTVATVGFLDRDIIVLKLDTTGTEIARIIQDGPGNNFDLPYELDVDGNGNVAITGMQSMNSANTANGDVATSYFNSQLTALWTRFRNGDSFTNDQGADMVVDADGNSYICGFTRSGDIMYEDLVVFKVNSSGQRLWKFIYTGNEETSSELGVAIAIDDQKNVYVTGTTDSSTGINSRDIYTVKLNPSGQLLWEQIYNGTASGSDSPVEIAVNSLGNTIVTANTVNTGTGLDATVLCYSPTGTLLWSTAFDKGGQAEVFHAMAIDNQNNIYAGGEYLPASGALSDGLLVKFDPAGTILWDTTYDNVGAISDRDFFNTIDLDDTGNIFVAGQSDFNFVTAKYSPAGTPLWIQNYSYSNFTDSACVLKVDPNGDVVVAGTFGQTVNADFGLVKYKNDGTFIWSKKLANSAGSDDILTDMAIDSIGGIYLTGWETSAFTTNYNFMTVKYDSAGAFKFEVIWQDLLGVAPDYGKRIGLDASGNIYVMGDANENCSGNVFVNGYRWNTQVIRYGQGVFVNSPDLQVNSEEVLLYPNPASEQINLTAPISVFGHSKVQVILFDALGKLIFMNEVSSGELYTQSVTHLENGIYFYILKNEIAQKTGKLIINKN
jgi:uncharacterized delta-60 repeat protein